MTVSRALHDNPKISEPVRRRVQQLAEEMGYQPDAKLSQLMAHLRNSRHHKATANLAWLSPYADEESRPDGDYRRVLLASVQERCAALGYHLDVIWFHEPKLSPARLVQTLRARGIEGVIVAPLGSRDQVLEIDFSPFAVTAIGYSVEEPTLHRVAENFFEDATLALRHLAAAGCERIGVAMSMDPRQHMVDHVRGAYAGDRLARDRPLLPLLISESLSDAKIRQWARETKVQGVLSNVDLADALAKRVRLAQIGFSGFRESSSGVRANLPAIGAAAVDMVVAQIHRNERGVPGERKTMLLSGYWREGGGE